MVPRRARPGALAAGVAAAALLGAFAPQLGFVAAPARIASGGPLDGPLLDETTRAPATPPGGAAPGAGCLLAAAGTVAAAAAHAGRRAGGARAPRRPRTARRFFDKIEDIAKDKAPSKSRSDDGFIAPRTAEEEEALMKEYGGEEGGFWKADWEDKPDSEKLLDPNVLSIFVLTALPFLYGGYVLVQSSND